MPDVAPPPCNSNPGGLTFGALASAYKLNDLTLDIWTRILLSSPASRMLIRAPTLAEPSNRDHLRARLVARGVAGERVDLEGGAAHFDFLQSYDRIDVALDTFPYNGGTTTTEALWQGVPVLTYVATVGSLAPARLFLGRQASMLGSPEMQTIWSPRPVRWLATRLLPPASLPCAPACAPTLRHLRPAIPRGCAWRWSRSIGNSGCDGQGWAG